MIEVHSHSDAAAFLALVTRHLSQEEARNNLLLGLADAIAVGRSYGAAPPVLATAERDGCFAGAAVQTPPYKVVLTPMEPACAQAFATWFGARDAALPGVNAEQAVAAAFADAYLAGGGRSTVEARMRIYELTELQPVAHPGGAPRVAGAGDRALVRDWVDAFHEEAAPRNPRGPEAWRAVDLQLDRGRYGLWLDADGEPVSLALRNRQLPSGESIGPVYTPLRRRGRGYATALVAEVTRAILADGRRYACLFTDLENPISNGIYPKIGYRRVADAVEVSFAGD